MDIRRPASNKIFIMGILSMEVQEFVKREKLGFVATVCPDGTPNLSPKGTATVWDDDHLIFADIDSPGTVQNLLLNPAIEINVVDVFIRKGYRFKGTAQVLTHGSLFESILLFYREKGTDFHINNIVLMKVDQCKALNSPVYYKIKSEEEVRAKWMEYWLKGAGNTSLHG